MNNVDRIFLEDYMNGKKTKDDIVPSPACELLGAQIINIDKESFKLTMRFQTRPEMINGAGVIQGGLLTSMLDTCMAFAVLSHVRAENSTATISINTDFLKPVKSGALIAEAEITRMGRNIAFAKAILKNESDEPVASATANLMVIG